MSKHIHFLNWDKPVAETVASYILSNGNTSVFDLHNVLIVVPTRESGRLLHEKLTVFCHARNKSLLGAHIVTPSFFTRPVDNAERLATSSLAHGILLQTLLELRTSDCQTLFPAGIPRQNHPWAFAAANMIQQLREKLCEGNLSITKVLERRSRDLEELARWQDLGKIESIYLKMMEKTGRLDPCEFKLSAVADPALPDETEKVIVAAVPDPSSLAITAMEELSKKIPVEILVMAPSELKNCFDDWGRPLPDKWSQRPIDIPAAEKNILVANSPASQAQTVVELILTGEYHPGDICIGVPDRAIIPSLQDNLENVGSKAFDPSDRPIKDHHLYHLVKAWFQLCENPSFANFAAFLRNADVLSYLHEDRKISPRVLLSELDQIQNDVLPQDMADIESALMKKSGYTDLNTALVFINEILAAARNQPVHEALRSFLKQIFSNKTLSAKSDEDSDFKEVASRVSGILNEFNYEQQHLQKLPPEAINLLIMAGLEEYPIPRHREGAMLDLNGWLELPWNDAELMLITGFNEGLVPESQKSDIFLPDSLKKTLGLRNNETRFARDAYLLSLILAVRKNKGRVVLITGKTTASGDPLKPSRLLFRCPDNLLAERTALIFKETEEVIDKPPFSVSFKLNPAAPLSPRAVFPEELHVTQFRDYLACPFRFYLKHILKMERMEYKAELDALDFGTMLHKILEQFCDNKKINRSADPAVIQKYLHGLLDDYFQNIYGNNDSFTVLYARTIAKQRLDAFAEYQALISADGWEIAARELACRLTISGMKVIGKIDRIDIHPPTGKMRIMDYKTSDAAEEPLRRHIRTTRGDIPPYARLNDTENKRWIDLQLPLYWLMLREHPAFKDKREDIELCYFNLPRSVSASGVSPWEDFNAGIASSALKSAEKIVLLITQGVYWPPAESVAYDDFEPPFYENMRDFFDGERIREFYDNFST